MSKDADSPVTRATPWDGVRPFYVYMLRCRDGALYVGHTDDLEARVAHHDAGTYDGFTALRRPVELVFAAELQTRDEAFARERQLKGWSHAKKEALIARDWPRVQALARGRWRRAPA